MSSIKGLTSREILIIHDNLSSYLANFGSITIVPADYGGGFYVYTTEEERDQGHYIQYCYNIDYLNGWLYGAVQAANKVMKRIIKME